MIGASLAVVVAVPATMLGLVSFLALKGTRPKDRPEILHALAEFSGSIDYADAAYEQGVNVTQKDLRQKHERCWQVTPAKRAKMRFSSPTPRKKAAPPRAASPERPG